MIHQEIAATREELEELLHRSYKGIRVLQAVLSTAKLTSGAEVALELQRDIEKLYPGWIFYLYPPKPTPATPPQAAK